MLSSELVMRESRIMGVLGYVRKDFEEEVAAALETSVLTPASMTTKRICSEELVAEGLETLLKVCTGFVGGGVG